MQRLDLSSSSSSGSANKIRVLTLIVHNFRLNLSRMGSTSKEFIAASMLSAFESMVLDKAWYKVIKASFSAAVKSGLTPSDWMANQLKELGVHEVSGEFQKKDPTTPDYDCMSFASDFMNEHLDIGHINSLPKINKDKLKIGDFILYYTTKFEHIALYVGEINGKSYAISKFGTGHNVFLHPIDAVPETYGAPRYFENKLHSKIAAKFERVKAELNKYSLTTLSTVEETKISTIDEAKTLPKEISGNGRALERAFLYLFKPERHGDMSKEEIAQAEKLRGQLRVDS